MTQLEHIGQLEETIRLRNARIEELEGAIGNIAELLDEWSIEIAQIRPEAAASVIGASWPGCGWQRVWQTLARRIYGLPEDASIEDLRLARAFRNERRHP